MRYIQYARRSSDERSHKQLQSIQGQEGDLIRTAHDLNLDIVERLEESRTAKEPGRPIFNAMLRRIEKGEADAILCWHIDRLTRNELDSGTIRWMLRKGVIREIRTPHKVYLPDDSAFITAIESAQSEQFIIDHTVRVNRGMKHKCRQGGIPFHVPQGYRNDPLTKRVEIDPDRFALICRLFRKAQEGTHSVAELHRLLHHEWGYRKKPYHNSQSSELSLNALHKLLGNPFYMGRFTWQGESYAHDLPRALSREQWLRVQEMLGKRAHKSRGSRRGKNRKKEDKGKNPVEDAGERETKPPFAYAGLITCASCGFQATAEVSKGHIYYHCNNRLKICTKKGVREEEVDRHIDRLLERISLPEEVEALVLEVWKEEEGGEAAAREAIERSRQQALEGVRRQKEALLGLFLQGHLDEGEYASKKRELNEQMMAMDGREDGRAEGDLEHEDRARALRLITRGRSLFVEGDAEIRRFVACHIAEEYRLNSGELEVRMNPLIEKVRYSLPAAVRAKDGYRTA